MMIPVMMRLAVLGLTAIKERWYEEMGLFQVKHGILVLADVLV